MCLTRLIVALHSIAWHDMAWRWRLLLHPVQLSGSVPVHGVFEAGRQDSL
jgi:hypothetical protein